MTTKAMTYLPDGISVTDELIAMLDDCLLNGFVNLKPAHRDTLNTVQDIFTGTPLGNALAESLPALQKGAFAPEHFRSLAAARAALQGAQYDHLHTHLMSMLQREPSEALPVVTDVSLPPPMFDGAAHWLMDIAIAGFARLDSETLTAFDSTLNQLQADPGMIGIATMLTGLMDELVGNTPVENESTAPVYRWVDLWSHALLMTAGIPALPHPQPVSGLFYPMGIAWQQQKRLASAVFYGILESEDTAGWARMTISAYVVDALKTDEMWTLLPYAQELLTSVRDLHAWQLTNMMMLPSGDLLFDETAIKVADAFNIHDIAEQYLVPGAANYLHHPVISPLRRHPVHLMAPVALENFSVSDGVLETDTLQLRLIPEPEPIINSDSTQLPLIDTKATALFSQELKLVDIAKQKQIIGLIRYDNGAWYLQPLLGLKGKSKVLHVGQSALKSFEKPPKTSTVAILQERASKLLREKK